MSLLFLIAALGALIWGLAFFRLAGIWGCCLAILLVGTVLGHPFFHVSLATLDRALLVAALALYVVHRKLGLAESRRWNTTDTLLVAFLVALTASTFAFDWRVDDYAPVGRLLFFYAFPAAMYWLARSTEITPGRLRAMFGIFAVFGLYLAATAVAERFDQGWAVFPRYIMNAETTEFLGRARGPLLNPSGNGVLLVLALSCAFMFLAKLNRVGKLILVAALVVYLLGLYCTLTRCAWLGGALAVLILLAAFLPRGWRAPTVATALIVSSLFVGLNWERLTAFKRDKHVSVADMRSSASLRPLLAVVAWKIFQDYPVMGCGLRQYREVAVNYLDDRTIDLPLEKARPYVQHNIFLSLLTETGIVGMGLFSLLLACWSLTAWRLWRCGDAPLETRQMGIVFLCTAVAYLANGMFQDVLIIPMVNMFLFFLAGVLRSLAEDGQPGFVSTERVETHAWTPGGSALMRERGVPGQC